MSTSLRRWLIAALLLFIPIVGGVVLRGNRVETVKLKVDLSQRTLKVIEDGDVVHTYGVAVGTRKHPTPTGSYCTGRIVWNPRWVPPPSKWARKFRPREPGDPRNPMQGVKI